jgi:hypothetical protein
VTTALLAGLLGLIGTVVGAGLTTLTARQTADRSHQRAREELQRQEYRSAVIRFATALGTYRTAEMDRWHARHGGWRDEAAASADVYRTRTAVWAAFYELDLSTNNRDLVRQARVTIARAGSIQQPDSQAEMDRRADLVQEDVTQLITIARTGKSAEPWDLPGPEPDTSSLSECQLGCPGTGFSLLTCG